MFRGFVSFSDAMPLRQERLLKNVTDFQKSLYAKRHGYGKEKMSIFSFLDVMPLRKERLLKNVQKRQKSLYAKRHGYENEKNEHFFVFGCHASSAGATFEKCYRSPKVAIREVAGLRKGEKCAFFRFRMPCLFGRSDF